MLGANTSKEGGTGGISVGRSNLSVATCSVFAIRKHLRKYRAMSRHCLLMDTPTATALNHKGTFRAGRRFNI